MAKTKLINFITTLTRRYEDVIGDKNSKLYIVKVRIGRATGRDLGYKVGDVVNNYGQEFKIIHVGEDVVLNNPSRIICDITMSRLVMSLNRGEEVDLDAQKYWESQTNKMLKKESAAARSAEKKAEIEIEQKRVLALSVKRRKELKKRKDIKEYADRCATGVGALEI